MTGGAGPARVVVLATRSTGKLRELRPLLAEAGWTALDLDAAGIAVDPAESGIEVHDTFEGNARAKAAWFAARTPHPVLAEDSGLEVDALDGAPGVHSKRWAGHDAPDGAALEGAALDAANNASLLQALARAAAEGRASRRARYRCVAVWQQGARVTVAHGTTEGAILSGPRGAGGFGYDPLFLSDDLGMSFGEATREAKSAVSHRARAVRQLVHGLGVDPTAGEG